VIHPELDKARDFLASRLPVRPRVHLVLGSGLGGLAGALEGGHEVSFSEVPGLPPASVAGHAGRFMVGVLHGVPVLLQAGRLHLYEGHDASTVAAPVRLGRMLGAEILMVTNATGGIGANLDPGSLVLIRDHLNLQFASPLTGTVRPGEERFPDMTEAYDRELRDLARAVAAELEIDLTEGVYAGVLGPAFETPAEIRALGHLGADVVGLSTVMEVLAARAGGMRCLGISLVTNLAAGRSETPLSHREVMETGDRSAARLQRLILGILAALPGVS
jgi:purine-nucleoside phosphorylase